jgi:uncharacterized glyoxalase superfamily protein PhnB
MKALSIIAVIHVTNLDRALTYYTTILGFELDFTFGDYAGLTYNAICIHLNGPTNQGQKKLPGSAHFCIDCDEVDTYFNTIVEKGAIILVPLADRVYGMRDCAVNDLDGNTLVFGQAIGLIL